jgi:hypothetical protein
VTLGQTLAGVSPVSVWVGGWEEWPYSVVNLAATRNVGHDVLYTWVPRVRANGEMHDGSDLTLTDIPEQYLLAVLDGNPQAITAITNDPTAGVVTVPAHGYSNGATLFVSGLQGMTELSGVLVTISNVTTNTFTIGLATSGMGVFLASGTPTVERVLRQITVNSPAATYTSAQQVSDWGSNQTSVRTVVFMVGVFGNGYSSFAVV